MRRMIGFALAALLLGGCAVYADPYPYAGPPVGGVYMAPAPVVGVAWRMAWRLAPRVASGEAEPGREAPSVRASGPLLVGGTTVGTPK